ncbi:hypothetical protein BUE80_DR006557 [Diplocarpon rosae]|nr:hypothetical protein BUE80_DR006557 [Diplocarpon rosae]
MDDYKWESVVFHSCAFIASVFLLQTGAALFTNNIAIIARRCGIPETLIALLTAGAEWEEVPLPEAPDLAVVVASIAQHQPSLGLGNVIGSSISNVMGAFALGLLSNPDPITFGPSATIYSGALFAVSTIFILLAFTQQLNLTGGIFFIVGFGVYVVSICSAIYDGILDPDPDVIAVEDAEASRMAISPTPSTDHHQLHVSIYPSVLQCHPTEVSPLLPAVLESSSPPSPPRPRRKRDHVLLVVIGLVALCIAACSLVHTACSLAGEIQVSKILIGLTLVSISTTIPEKAMSLISDWHRNTASMTATTAGSNIFLLTLCAGILLVSWTQGDADSGGKRPGPGDRNVLLTDQLVAFEVWCVWGCSVLLIFITWIGARRWLGALMFGFYISFLMIELTLFKR